MVRGYILLVGAGRTRIVFYGARGSGYLFGMRWSSGCGLADTVMRGRGQSVGWKEIQGCESQKGGNWGVRTHHDFGGAERQSIFYFSVWLEMR
jgi:hypothetical protein